MNENLAGLGLSLNWHEEADCILSIYHKSEEVAAVE